MAMLTAMLPSSGGVSATANSSRRRTLFEPIAAPMYLDSASQHLPKISGSNSAGQNSRTDQMSLSFSASSSAHNLTKSAIVTNSAGMENGNDAKMKSPSAESLSTSNSSSYSSPGGSNSRQNRSMGPDEVLRLYGNKLSPYEQAEIFSYPQIYFVGPQAKKRPGVLGSANNCGYDDENGSYLLVPHDHIAYRYEVLKVIGKGSFGQVVKAIDHKTQEQIALKIVRNEKRFHRQAEEEIRILDHLRTQDKLADNTMNIIHMRDYFTFRQHKCITFELLSINLYELIKKNKFQGFSLQLVRKFAHSILMCLDGLYANKLIHCDLKPENILLKQHGRSGIKVSP